MEPLMGVFPPVVTLFKKDGTFDYEANEKHADFLIGKGVDGLAYLGTSGEFSILSVEEKKEYITNMTAYVNHRTKVIVGAGSTNISETQELLKCSEQAEVDGVLLINPYFSVYEAAMVEAFFDAAISVTRLPVIIYNFPQLTGFNCSYELILNLVRKHPNLVGIKDTIADLVHIRKMSQIKKEKPDFTVFCAYEEQSLGAVLNGGNGFINATANFAPEFTVGLYQAIKENDFVKVKKYYEKMCQAMELYEFSQPLFLACKEAVCQRVIGRECYERLPAVSLDRDVKIKIGQKLNTIFDNP